MKAMFMRLLKWGVFLFVLLVGLIVTAFVALHFYQPTIPITVFPAPKPISGAAVFYTQAVAALPTLSGEEKKLTDTKSSEPLESEAARQLLAKYDASLQLVIQGAMQPQCEWGLDRSQGPAMHIPNVAQMVRLGKMLAIRARLRLLTGDSEGATGDLLLMFRFARHLGEPKLIINYMAQIVLNNITIDLTLRNLQQFDPVSLQHLSELVSVTPSHSVRESLVSERELLIPFAYNQLANAVHVATKDARGAQPSPAQGGKDGQDFQTHNPVPEIKITGGPTVKLLVYWIRISEQKSLELEKLLCLPYAEARPQLDAYRGNLQKYRWINGPYALMNSPFAGSLRFREVQMEGAWAIFRTALDAQIHTPSSVRAELAKLRNPYDGSPLEIRDVEDGIEEKLKGPPDMNQMTLTIGLQKK